MKGGVHKEYLALVAGAVTGERGRIALPIGDDDDSVIYVKRVAGVGQPSLTEWQVEWRAPDPSTGSGQARTLLRLFPRTGRRHQLRVHLAAIGHPILGDILYGRPDGHYLELVKSGVDSRARDHGPRRQLLHCARLEFTDPAAKETVVVEAPLPEDFREWMTGEGPAA
jgi:23S rRNA pseudouridine1911/1915/1917 synthase